MFIISFELPFVEKHVFQQKYDGVPRRAALARPRFGTALRFIIALFSPNAKHFPRRARYRHLFLAGGKSLKTTKLRMSSLSRANKVVTEPKREKIYEEFLHLDFITTLMSETESVPTLFGISKTTLLRSPRRYTP
jgi:hypothetical protein